MSDYERYKAKTERERARKAERARKLELEAEARKKRAAEREHERKLRAEQTRERLAERDKRRKEAERVRAEKARAREKLSAERAEKRKIVYAKIRSAMRNGKSGFGYKNFGILPRVGLRVRGDCATVATKLSQSGIKIEDMAKDGGFVRFKIRKKDCRKAIAILNEMCYTYESDGSYGVGRLCAFMLVRAGLLAGACLSVVAMNVLYSRVWRVEISGNDRLSSAAISSVLHASGIQAGLKKSDVDCDGVSALVGGIDGVSDASCEIVGTTLKVYVLESKEFAEHTEYGAYYSDYDATVTRIIVRSGTSVVERGSIVKAGELLVDGNVYSTAGELMYSDMCDAEVYGEVALVFTAELGSTAVEYKRTGNFKRRVEFELFGHRLFAVEPPFASYESVKTTANYDVLLPLYVSVYEFYETAPEEVERDINALATEFATQKAEELGFVGDFEAQTVVTGSVSGLWSVHVFLSGEVLISRGGAAPAPSEPKQKS